MPIALPGRSPGRLRSASTRPIAGFGPRILYRHRRDGQVMAEERRQPFVKRRRRCSARAARGGDHRSRCPEGRIPSQQELHGTLRSASWRYPTGRIALPPPFRLDPSPAFSRDRAGRFTVQLAAASCTGSSQRARITCLASTVHRLESQRALPAKPWSKSSSQGSRISTQAAMRTVASRPPWRLGHLMPGRRNGASGVLKQQRHFHGILPW